MSQTDMAQHVDQAVIQQAISRGLHDWAESRNSGSQVRVAVPDNEASIQRALHMVRTEVDSLLSSMPGSAPSVNIIVTRDRRTPDGTIHNGTHGQQMRAAAVAGLQGTRHQTRRAVHSRLTERQRALFSSSSPYGSRNGLRRMGTLMIMGGNIVYQPHRRPTPPNEYQLEPEKPVVLPSWSKRERASAEDMPTPAYVCPITQDTMRDPVIAADGHTYERSAIQKWLDSNDTSPKTNLPLVHKQLTSNHALRQAIDDHHISLSQKTQTAIKSPKIPRTLHS